MIKDSFSTMCRYNGYYKGIAKKTLLLYCDDKFSQKLKGLFSFQKFYKFF